LDEAIAEYRKAIKIDQRFGAAHIGLGKALHERGQPDEAIAEYRKAIALEPEVALAHNNLGVSLRDKRQWDEAIAEYRKAIDLEPNLAMAHVNLGNVLADKCYSLSAASGRTGIVAAFARTRDFLGWETRVLANAATVPVAVSGVLSLCPRKTSTAHHTNSGESVHQTLQAVECSTIHRSPTAKRVEMQQSIAPTIPASGCSEG